MPIDMSTPAQPRGLDFSSAPPVAVAQPPQPRLPLQRGLDAPLPLQSGLGGQIMGRPATPAHGVVPVRPLTRTQTQTIDPEELNRPAISRKAVRETGEAKMGSGFWDETSGEIDLNAPRFRGPRD